MELSPKGHWKVAARKNQGPTKDSMSFGDQIRVVGPTKEKGKGRPFG